MSEFLTYKNIPLVRKGNTVYFGDIERLKSKQGSPLVTGHMKSRVTAFGIFANEIADGCSHHTSPSDFATATEMAHSILLRNSLQPYS